MKALKNQLLFELEKNMSKNKKLESIFIGGGTPSTIKAEDYQEIFDILDKYIDKNCEITTEANPNSATTKWLKGMKKLGVNRISFGVQSFNDIKLKRLNRAHNSNSAINAIQNANSIGFKSINCDIIYGFDGDDFSMLKKDFDTIFKLPVNHISAYSLTLEEGTKFFNKTELKIDDEDLSYEIFDYLSKNGFNQYEISNFSKNKCSESKHNYGYWQYKDYIGIGAGAVGCVDNIRYYSNKNIEEYIINSTKYKIEKLSKNDVIVEKILLGLRCTSGFNKNILNKNQQERVEYLLENKKLTKNNDYIFNQNFLLADELALYILE